MSSERGGTVVVLACGNPSRGDDAIGPLLLARLESWLSESGWADDFVLVEEFQLQVENALDLQGMSAALFIDAGEGTAAPFSLLPAVPAEAVGHSTHALSPGAVLAVYRQITGEAAPPAEVLCVRGESFELGAPPSTAALAHVEAAWSALQAWCRAHRRPGEAVSAGGGTMSHGDCGRNVTKA